MACFFFLILSQCETVVSMTGSMILHAKPALKTAVQAFQRAKTVTTRANLHRSRHAALPLFVTFVVLQLDSEGSHQKVQKQTGHLVPVRYSTDQLISGSFCVLDQRNGVFFVCFFPHQAPKAAERKHVLLPDVKMHVSVNNSAFLKGINIDLFVLLLR